MARKTKAELQRELNEANHELEKAKNRIVRLEAGAKHLRELLPIERHKVAAITFRESMFVEQLASYAPKRSIQELEFNQFLKAIYVIGKEVGESRASTKR